MAAGFVFLLSAAPPVAEIAVDYPEPGSVFPSDFAPPTFLWRDPSKAARLWRIEASFSGGVPPLRAVSRGPRLRLGPIDPDCVAETNQPPALTPLLAAARTWKPTRAAWETIKKYSAARPARITITGLTPAGQVVSRGAVAIRTSTDPVGAPIFYRDVPLMPTETSTGIIKPIAPYAVRLVAWRLRSVSESSSRLVLENLPVCANCHSFSSDARTLGMDLNGLRNNKGLYMLASVSPRTAILSRDVIQWSTPEGALKGDLRVGFMSQVSPCGRYVVTTINPEPVPPGGREPPNNYYVQNFKDYRFLQVFYPTRGILAWYSRATGVLRPLPGADDTRYVQMGAVWSPGGEYLVFARAAAKDPNPGGAPPARYANDPNENQVRYDLYRVPFNEGRGGDAERIPGASQNGMSNSFPKVSPDGRWIVFVQSRNGQLMRPDSRLFIVPFAGGSARLMRCNTPLMNSWHSFSPNGRWMVFSSKSRSPYTQMYLTHIDSSGNDSPPILIENSTASNRAVNLPEFLNLPPDGLQTIGGPALDYYRFFDRALYLQRQSRHQESAAFWQKVLEIDPDDDLAHGNLALVLALSGRRAEAGPHFARAREIRRNRARQLPK